MTTDQPGILRLVATPIGNLEDITYRAVRVLGEASIIAAEDTRSAMRLLSHYGLRRPRLVSFFTGNEAARSAELVDELLSGSDVAVISDAGTPGISDPGERIARAAASAGIRVEVIPGPAAAIVGLVGSGLPTARFTFVGFPPRETGARHQLFGQLRTDPSTIILYEAPDRVATTLADLLTAFGKREAVLARELTKLHEEYARGDLAELEQLYRNEAPRGECTILVAGADPDAARAEIDIEAELGKLLEAGFGPKDAAARLVISTGKPRRHLYQLALALKRQR